MVTEGGIERFVDLGSAKCRECFCVCDCDWHSTKAGSLRLLIRAPQLDRQLIGALLPVTPCKSRGALDRHHA
jgi:hypothetical protein